MQLLDLSYLLGSCFSSGRCHLLSVSFYILNRFRRRPYCPTTVTNGLNESQLAWCATFTNRTVTVTMPRARATVCKGQESHLWLHSLSSLAPRHAPSVQHCAAARAGGAMQTDLYVSRFRFWLTPCGSCCLSDASPLLLELTCNRWRWHPRQHQIANRDKCGPRVY